MSNLGGDSFGGIEYAGDESGNEPALPETLSNVEDFDSSVGRLGCADYTAFVTGRCGGPTVCVLEGIEELEYFRKLDEIADATVTINLGGSVSTTCCECLGILEPLCHELHIWRDGEEVWVGPIIDVIYGYNKVVIKAQDRLYWTTIRVVPDTGGGVGYQYAATDVSDIAEDVLAATFALDAPTFTCEFDQRHVTASGVVIDFDFPAYSAYNYDVLLALAEAGLDFTTVGGTIVLAGDSTSFNPLILLTDDHIIGDVELTKNGSLMGNRFYVNFDGDMGIPAVSAPVDTYCYGDVEQLRSGEGLPDQTTAELVADSYAAAGAIAPRTLEIPPGSKLAPFTPWVIDDMVCGARVDVSITRLCVKLTQSFRLVQVEGRWGASNGEEILISLSPLNFIGED